jgi:hypothetical protein
VARAPLRHPSTWSRGQTAISRLPRDGRGVTWAGDDGVSPVVGTILVLAITILGIAAITYWGAPMVARVQAGNAQVAMQGEFEGLRDATQELSVPDHSRFPAIAVPGGTLGIERGTRFLVSVSHDPVNPACDLDVRGWGPGGNANQVTLNAPGCRPVTSANFEVHEVNGGTLTEKPVSVGGSTVTVTGADLKSGDWLFRITDGAASNPVVYAEAWLHSSERIRWRLDSPVGERGLDLEGGAIFASDGGTTYLHKAPPIGDASFGANYYGLWLRTYGALSRNSITSAGTHQVFMALTSNDMQVDADASRLRYTFQGDLAEAWCNAMLLRNRALQGIATYSEDVATASCATGNAEGLRSLTFDYDNGSTFTFRFLHARIQASLV